MDPIVTRTFGDFTEQYLAEGVCPLCYFKEGKVEIVVQHSPDSGITRKNIELANDHMAKVHSSQWRFLGEQGRASLLLADISQLAEHPETVEEMYETLMDSYKDGKKGFDSLQFRSGRLTHDVQAVIVNESGGGDWGSMTFGRLDPTADFHWAEVRVVWGPEGVNENDRDFAEFFVGVSNILYLVDLTIDVIQEILMIKSP